MEQRGRIGYDLIVLPQHLQQPAVDWIGFQHFRCAEDQQVLACTGQGDIQFAIDSALSIEGLNMREQLRRVEAEGKANDVALTALETFYRVYRYH